MSIADSWSDGASAPCVSVECLSMSLMKRIMITVITMTTNNGMFEAIIHYQFVSKQLLPLNTEHRASKIALFVNIMLFP